MDVLPTIIELLGLPVPAKLQGETLVPLMHGTPSEGARPLFAEVSFRAMKTVQLSSYSSKGWKLIETTVSKKRIELFHLAEDRGEGVDLSGRESETAARLLEEMNQFRSHLTTGRGGTVKLDAKEIAELRALGYMPEEASSP